MIYEFYNKNKKWKLFLILLETLKFPRISNEDKYKTSITALNKIYKTSWRDEFVNIDF